MSLPTPELTRLVTERSRELAYELVEPVAQFLSIARDLCEGDLEEVLIMVAISLRSSLHPEFRALGEDELDRRLLLPGLGTNVSALAQSTGVPRETVRRKVARLVERLWVTPEDQSLYYTSVGYRCVEPARSALIAMHVCAFATIGRLVG